jgi:hypothetical protein
MTTVSNNTYTQAATFRSSEFAAQTKTGQSALKLDVAGTINALRRESFKTLFGHIGMDESDLNRADRVLNQVNDFLTEVNTFLARSDLTDAQRSSFLKRFFGTAIDPDDADGVGHDASSERQTSALSTLIAAAVSGDLDALDQMLNGGGMTQAIDEQDIAAMINNATKDMGEWRDKNGVAHTPDLFVENLRKAHAEANKFFDELAMLSPREKLNRIRERNAKVEAAFGVQS